MHMNREIWEKIVGFVSIQNYPILPCPYCMNYSLSIDKESVSYRKASCSSTSALIAKETSNNIQDISDVLEKNIFLGVLMGIGVIATSKPKEPAKFISFFKCENCVGSVSATGTSQYPIVSNSQNSSESPLIKVEYFSPPIPIFDVSSSVPSVIKKEVLQSFNHFHSDICSSGANLRRSVEKLCFDLGYKEKNLHRSISAMEKQFPREAVLLHSLKLLGNEAAHSDMVNEEDLLDAFEVQEFVLGIFDRIKTEEIIKDKANKLKHKFENKKITKVKE
jgi:Domain of unknown function (DUF4145)